MRVLVDAEEPEYCDKQGHVGTVVGVTPKGYVAVEFDDGELRYFYGSELDENGAKRYEEETK